MSTLRWEESLKWRGIALMAMPWSLTTESFGRPFVDKPSFDGLPPESLNYAQTSLLAADHAAAEWELLELLFERNWYGPCSCLGSVWGSNRQEEGSSSDLDSAENAPVAGTTVRPTPAGAYMTQGVLRFFRIPQAQTPNARQTVLSSNTRQATIYGVGAAPLQQPAFVSVSPYESSPQKAVPVPKCVASSATENGHNSPLLTAVVTGPPQAAAAAIPRVAEPLRVQLMPSSRSDAKSAAEPQLGTWADRQYRLLDAVPERGECDSGSLAGNSGPCSASASNYRSPDVPMTIWRNGETGSVGVGSGSGGCGSGSGECNGAGGSSSVQTLSHLPAVSPTQFYLLDKQKHEQHADHHLNSHNSQTVLKKAQAYMSRNALNHFANEERDVTVHPQEQLLLQQRQSEEIPGRQMDAEAMIQDAAWRWRFTRRWQAEQARTGPDQASSAPRDRMEEALAYLQTTNTTTVSMQIANVSSRRGGSNGSGSRCGTSLDGSLTLTSGMMGTLGTGGSTLGGDWLLTACGSGSGSFTSGPRILARQSSGELLVASREVDSLNRRAVRVLQHQLNCEQEADRRVQESLGQGTPWVGHFIPIVHIDEWGSFRFLMLKLRDQLARSGGAPGVERQRILIRGHNYGSEGQLMEDCNREIMSLSHKHAVPFEAPTCMGGGVMEWRRDRDRHLHLHSGFVMDRALPLGMIGGNIPSRPAVDFLNLAAALVRQSFPPTYKITVLT